uniref:Permuted papain-like amidase enzyme, YaeF/YiiX, C92 family n=1 Tax=Candidatus Kentrum sp. UNK TaxID=2126344 RepID=A0A451B6B5_9GAMM|nr:MAG: Orthopoxvirus protein of unknown function (DUF830) [Candidatus Kentron sp. UNK]VFK73829.1 MAG: Orthopoxvirus protein of unknown function (DUF830) [Candidatus Kentron sp. UNK]
MNKHFITTPFNLITCLPPRLIGIETKAVKRLNEERERLAPYRLPKANYPRKRAEIRSGDIVAYDGNLIGQMIIQCATESPFAHVGLVIVQGGRVYVLESRGKTSGVAMAPLSNRLKHCYHFPVLAPWDEAKNERAQSKVSVVSYGFLDALRAGFHLNPKRHGEQCAEYVSGVHGIRCYTPKDVVRWALDNEDMIRFNLDPERDSSRK